MIIVSAQIFTELKLHDFSRIGGVHARYFNFNWSKDQNGRRIARRKNIVDMVVFVPKQFSNGFRPHKENFSFNERLIKYRIEEESVEIEKIRFSVQFSPAVYPVE